ncbi:PucR family transcriptional regulator [Rhodococcus sp. ABRD24]|uniref:PucR family transcriptional regulator n=1 Tax=Rhodococcus sp. ABRD24 TaxID=2507582 RepID=UPI001038B471|nr:PucR family transcriptional regulator [Rhodococcus sp. ABRD24]QBJ94819.1 PucR family transcriptional regulator [Rhodococcus sp. ABRD24]
MNLPVRWLLSQPELALELKAGAAGLGADVTFVVTTELSDPAQWLSGGELILTTGIGLPLAAADRRTYMRNLSECGVAAIGFGTGLSHPEVPGDLVTAAEELGLPLFEVPLPTPFVAVAKKVMGRLGEQQYEAMLRASRAQPRMTRAAIQGGAGATIRELSVACSATVVLLDPSAQVIDAYPARVDTTALAEIVALTASGTGVASSSVALDRSGATVAVQSISAGNVVHGYLAAVSASGLGYVDQILLGHANSLLALDFEKPRRLRAAQNRLNSEALGLLLSTDLDLGPARKQVAQAADDQGRVRAMTVLCDDTAVATRVATAADEQMTGSARQLFARRDDTSVTVLLRGTDGPDFVRRLVQGLRIPDRKSVRVGLSTPHPIDKVAESVEQSRLTASAAEYGGRPVEFATLAGSALLTFPESRRVLDALADTMITPLVEHDARQGTELLASLRAYLEANGHWESAAATLGVHRHTLRSRIARVEAILGCDMGVARVRAELLLAIISRQC